MGHKRVNFLKAHTLFNCPLHSNQSDSILVLQQLSHSTHSAVSEMIDVIDNALGISEFNERLAGKQYILLAKDV